MKFREIRTGEDTMAQIAAEITAGNLITGEYPRRVEEAMRLMTGAARSVVVSSGTMALKIALDCMGIGKNDVVIVPDITFIACASVIAEMGAVPVFVDTDPDTLQLDEKSTCEAIGAFQGRVRAIMTVKLGGEQTPEWVWGLGFPVLVDSAHEVSHHDARAVATCYSFHAAKMVPGIEGGCIATNDHTFAAKARRLRLFGFKEGQRVSRELGYKANMTNVSACLIAGNLAQIQAIRAQRTRVRDRYNAAFGLKRQGIGYYMVLVDDPDAVCREIPAIRHYPEPLSEMLTGEPINAKSKWIADHLVSIPQHEHLTDGDVDIVSATIKPRLITYLDQNGTQEQRLGGV